MSFLLSHIVLEKLQTPDCQPRTSVWQQIGQPGTFNVMRQVNGVHEPTVVRTVVKMQNVTKAAMKLWNGKM